MNYGNDLIESPIFIIITFRSSNNISLFNKYIQLGYNLLIISQCNDIYEDYGITKSLNNYCEFDQLDFNDNNYIKTLNDIISTVIDSLTGIIIINDFSDDSSFEQSIILDILELRVNLNSVDIFIVTNCEIIPNNELVAKAFTKGSNLYLINP